MAGDKEKPIIPDYGQEVKPDAPKGSFRRILSDMVKDFVTEIAGQVILPGIICLIAFLLWANGCFGRH